MSCLQCGIPRFDPWAGKIPWRRKWQPTPVLLPGKFHGLRSLVGYSPWGRNESDTTERLHFTSLHRPGEFIFQCPVFLPFHTVHGVLKANILKWFAIPFSSGPRSVRPFHHDQSHPSWVAPHCMAHSFIELDKTVVCVTELVSFLTGSLSTL